MPYKKYDWEIAFPLLGKITDKEIEDRFGIPRAQVAQMRARHNIEAINPRRGRNFEWASEIIDKLGKVPDGKLAKELGVSIGLVMRKRQQLGIKGQNTPKLQLTEEILSQLGTITDEKLAEKAGVNRVTISRYRKLNRIAAHGHQGLKKKKPAWDQLKDMPQSDFIKHCCAAANINYRELADRCYISHSRIQKWAAPGTGQQPISMAYRRLVYLETHKPGRGKKSRKESAND